MSRALLLLLVLVTPVRAQDSSDLAARVSAAAGVDRWPSVTTVAFTWKHHPSGNERSYVWSPSDGTVVKTQDGESITVTMDAIDSPEERRAHAAFVNDHYWMLFELRLAWDTGVEFEDLGPQPVPRFEDMEPHRALRVHYVGEGGYTPGDAYALFLGEDDLPVAWAFYREDMENAALVTTREDWQTVSGIHFPSRFVTPEGETFISISDVRIE